MFNHTCSLHTCVCAGSRRRRVHLTGFRWQGISSIPGGFSSALFRSGSVPVSLSDGDLLIGPCRSQRPGRRQEARAGQGGPGSKEIIEERIGPKDCLVDRRSSTPFPGRAGEKVKGAVLTTKPPPPLFVGQPGQVPTTPPPQSYPFPQETII